MYEVTNNISATPNKMFFKCRLRSADPLQPLNSSLAQSAEEL